MALPVFIYIQSCYVYTAPGVFTPHVISIFFFFVYNCVSYITSTFLWIGEDMVIYRNAPISDLWCQYKLNHKEIVQSWNEDTLPCCQGTGDSARFPVSSSELPFFR